MYRGFDFTGINQPKSRSLKLPILYQVAVRDIQYRVPLGTRVQVQCLRVMRPAGVILKSNQCHGRRKDNRVFAVMCI